MANALKNYAASKSAPVPQTQKASKGQKRNNAGGFSFKISDLDRVRRFLILGTEGGTYYVGQQRLTEQNAKTLVKAIKSDEQAVLDLIVQVSDEALAPKNDQAIFALAMVFVHGQDTAAANEAFGRVVRTATHLFMFVDFLKSMGKFGLSKQKAVANWYLSRTPEDLAYQVVKYRSRNGYSHRDVLRLTHPKGIQRGVDKFIMGKPLPEDVPEIIVGFQKAIAVTTAKQAVEVLREYPNLPWEAFPTSVHSDAGFWKALVEAGMGQTALLRNVTRFAKLGLFKDMDFTAKVVEQLTNEEAVRKGRLHPMNYLNALQVYQNGAARTDRYGYTISSGREWTVDAKVAGALEDGYYLSFKNVVPSGKRTLIGLDVSGSMIAPVSGLNGMSARQASAAMAQVTIRTEPKVQVMAFTGQLVPLDISDRDTLDTIVRKVGSLPFGRTDCAQPMLYALKNKIEVDTFIIYTDNETWAGTIHPHKALEKYRKEMGIDARLVVVGMTSTGFSIANPLDTGMLDVVGFDSSAPKMIAEFSAGRI